MKLLINTSNIKKSGALQVTLSFLEEIKHNRNHLFVVVLSDAVEAQIDKKNFGDNFKFYTLSLITPFRKSFKEYLRKMHAIENNFKPDCVFSVFAPTYWTPNAPHLSGFAYPWNINPDSKFIQHLPLKTKIKNTIENYFKNYYFKRNSEYFVTETEDVKQRLSNYIGIKPEYIFVVGNTYNQYFANKYISSNIKLRERQEHEFRIVTLSSNFAHKNLAIIAEVNRILKEKKGYKNIYFYLTINDKNYKTMFYDENIMNLGIVKASDCPAIYTQCDAMLLPTFLECFSASYPESMIMGKPILTSDLDFAHDICQDAALFFDPLNPEDIADKIISLMKDKNLYNSLVEKGYMRVKDFPTATERANRYIQICEKISNK